MNDPTPATLPGPPVTEQLAAASELCRRVLSSNWRQGEHAGTPYGYTSPSPGRYPWQWYWDSCFAAIVWRRFDPTRARRELESLLSAAEKDGFIGHTIFWGEPVDRLRSLFYNVTSREDFMTRTIQPPLLAYAWSRAVGDPSLVPAIARHHERVEQLRDLDGDGLLWIIQPDESGLDASPMFDRVWGWRSDGRIGFPWLVHFNRRYGFDIKRLLEAGSPVVCEVLTNVAAGLSRDALGRASITQALLERLYDERTGLFHEQVRGGRRAIQGRNAVTWASLAPLALPDLPVEIGRRLVEEHLLDPQRFWTAVAPPSVSLQDPSFSLRDRRLFVRRYWRGPTWVNSAWFVALGLRRLGYDEAADELARGVAGAVLASGLREYYNPFTGAGMGAFDFTWSMLVLELLDPSG